MIIAGGTYIERCVYPSWNRLFGSGLRAALALQTLSPSSSLCTYAPSTYRADVEATLNSVGIAVEVTESEEERVFEWLHPFELVRMPEPPKQSLPPLITEGNAVLRFGMIEGTAVVKAKRAVYDPQNEKFDFFANGSECRELVVILSERDLLQQTGRIGPTKSDAVRASINELFELRPSNLESFAILLKDGLGSLRVYVGDEPSGVPSYAAESFFKIGTGDVLAAAFAHAWAERRLNILDAADYAARALAWFVEDARLPLPAKSEFQSRLSLQMPRRVRIIGAETLEMGQLLSKTEQWLDDLHIQVAFDLFGEGKSEDLSTLVLVGGATDFTALSNLATAAAGVGRTVVFWPDALESMATHLFPDARITGDYASALFHLLREPLR